MTTAQEVKQICVILTWKYVEDWIMVKIMGNWMSKVFLMHPAYLCS